MAGFRFSNPLTALALAGLLAAQSSQAQVSTGAFSGKFAPTDTVTLRNLGSNQTREVKVKADGSFWARRLPVGDYEITVRHADGSESRFKASARIGTTTRIE
jgi:hypothetical protein